MSISDGLALFGTPRPVLYVEFSLKETGMRPGATLWLSSAVLLGPDRIQEIKEALTSDSRIVDASIRSAPDVDIDPRGWRFWVGLDRYRNNEERDTLRHDFDTQYRMQGDVSATVRRDTSGTARGTLVTVRLVGDGEFYPKDVVGTLESKGLKAKLEPSSTLNFGTAQFKEAEVRSSVRRIVAGLGTHIRDFNFYDTTDSLLDED